MWGVVAQENNLEICKANLHRNMEDTALIKDWTTITQVCFDRAVRGVCVCVEG
jgi:hypothetical protein